MAIDRDDRAPYVTPLELGPVAREVAWAALWLGVTALVIDRAAWSYPQRGTEITMVGLGVLFAAFLLCARDVLRAYRHG